jgi:uncharacterized RDD family membrane protein YckC
LSSIDGNNGAETSATAPEIAPATVPRRVAAMIIDVNLTIVFTKLLAQAELSYTQYRVVALTIILGYFAAMESLWGWTVAKKLLKIKVVRWTGTTPDCNSRPSIASAFLRRLCIVWWVVFPVTHDLRIGIPNDLVLLTSCIVDANNRGLHDRLAGTVVVRDRRGDGRLRRWVMGDSASPSTSARTSPGENGATDLGEESKGA